MLWFIHTPLLILAFVPLFLTLTLFLIVKIYVEIFGPFQY